MALRYAGALLLLWIAAGCESPRRMQTPVRYRRGVVYVLPGIEGRSSLNRSLALGLDEGGVTSAIEIYDWTLGLPGGYVLNLTDLERNRVQAARLAERILAQRERYPGCPIYLVGHSGGGGIAVLALEALPPGRQIDMAILLAPALSPEYDLTTALRRTRLGIYNFHSERDVGFLQVGTVLFGSIDREHGPSAGAVGFVVPPDLSAADEQLYVERLHQIAWNERLARRGASGSHIGWASRQFARDYLAPLVTHSEAWHPLLLERAADRAPAARPAGPDIGEAPRPGGAVFP